MNFRARAETIAWGAQRASAAVLGVCVLVHLATILYAVRGGLTAAEILGRTRGSAALALFYGLFVVAVSIHAPLGLRTIARETFGWRGGALDLAAAAVAVFLVWFGWRAVGGLFG
ncbi:MAG: succinate dehydrogenase [Alphaproteobacteria bacterium]|nr:succinate dehydrogenase [Alphaproteobacteria bacterium]